MFKARNSPSLLSPWYGQGDKPARDAETGNTLGRAGFVLCTKHGVRGFSRLVDGRVAYLKNGYCRSYEPLPSHGFGQGPD